MNKLQSKNKLATYSFIHSSALGSYAIPCKVISTNDQMCVIEYIDPVIDEKTIKIIFNEDLITERS